MPRRRTKRQPKIIGAEGQTLLYDDGTKLEIPDCCKVYFCPDTCILIELRRRQGTLLFWLDQSSEAIERDVAELIDDANKLRQGGC